MRRVALDQLEDFVAHGCGAALVRIEAEDPFVPAGLDFAVAQFAEAGKRNLYDARTERFSQRRSAVGALGIRHDDLVGPQYARHRRLDFGGFVVGYDVGGYFRHGPGYWLNQSR